MKRILLSILVIGILFPTACGTPATAPETETPSTPETEQLTLTTYSLSISISPSGAGSVSPLDGQHEEGTRVTLTATPTSGYTFDYWGGDASSTSPTITITMDSDNSVTAHFKEKEVATYSLSVSVQPSGSGSVTPSSGDHLAGTDVTLGAIAAPGYEFDHWSGDASGSLPTTTITMASNRSVIAHFEVIEPAAGSLQISKVRAVNYPFHTQGVDIEWETNLPAVGWMQYGPAPLPPFGYKFPPQETQGMQATRHEEITTAHKITLWVGAGTTYHFRVISAFSWKDAVRGDMVVSEEYTFTTPWVTVYLPLPKEVSQANYSQGIKSLNFTYSISPSETIRLTDRCGNTWEAASWQEKLVEDKLVASLEAVITREMGMEPVNTSNSYPIPEELIPEEVRLYLQPSPYSQSDDPTIIEQAKALAEGLEKEVEVVEKTVDWVNQNIRNMCPSKIRQLYPDAPEHYIDAVTVLKYRAGICPHFALLAIALLRAQGIPARDVKSLLGSSHPDSDPHYLTPTEGNTWHHQVEVYYPEVGWVRYDPTNAPTWFPRGVPFEVWLETLHPHPREVVVPFSTQGSPFPTWRIAGLEKGKAKVTFTYTITFPSK